VKSIINGDIKNWIIENTKVKITANDTAVNLCPAVWCMENPIPINVNIKAKELKN
jgi:hypothetical protein